MKKFRVMKSYLVTGWAYVKAENIEEAEKILSRHPGSSGNFEEIAAEWDYYETHWDTLAEVEE